MRSSSSPRRSSWLTEPEQIAVRGVVVAHAAHDAAAGERGAERRGAHRRLTLALERRPRFAREVEREHALLRRGAVRGAAKHEQAVRRGIDHAAAIAPARGRRAARRERAPRRAAFAVEREHPRVLVRVDGVGLRGEAGARPHHELRERRVEPDEHAVARRGAGARDLEPAHRRAVVVEQAQPRVAQDVLTAARVGEEAAVHDHLVALFIKRKAMQRAHGRPGVVVRHEREDAGGEVDAIQLVVAHEFAIVSTEQIRDVAAGRLRCAA
jgi:hypothetical protein